MYAVNAARQTNPHLPPLPQNLHHSLTLPLAQIGGRVGNHTAAHASNKHTIKNANPCSHHLLFYMSLKSEPTSFQPPCKHSQTTSHLGSFVHLDSQPNDNTGGERTQPCVQQHISAYESHRSFEYFSCLLLSPPRSPITERPL